jgi:hypothetical protein
MNNKTRPRLSLATLLLTATLTGRAQTWETLLPSSDFAPGWSGASALLDPFSADPGNPGIFIGCWSDSPEGIGSVLRLDSTSASSYAVSVVDSELMRVNGLGFNPANDVLYAVGEGPRVTTPPFPRVNPTVWKVRKSTIGNVNSWTTDDTFALTTTTYASPRGITADASGNVYVCGEASPKSGSLRWLVRKLPLGGTWTTVSEVSGQGDAFARGICCFPGNSANTTEAVLVVGVINNKWTVLRSQNRGGTWQTVDSWSPSSKAAATASKIATDSVGNLYVVGWRGTWLYPIGWVVRMSSNGGNSWTTVLDTSEGAYSSAGSVSTDGVGNVWISGYTMNPAGTPRWTVLKNGVFGTLAENNAGFLQTRQLPFGDHYSKARGIATGEAGDNVFITGELQWVDGTSRVALQRLLP